MFIVNELALAIVWAVRLNVVLIVQHLYKLLFSEVFGIELPRSTAEQRHLGRKINKSELKKRRFSFLP